jgi:hypothetical protein
MTAAKATALMEVSMLRSKSLGMTVQSLRRQNIHWMTLLCLMDGAVVVISDLAVATGFSGMTARIPRS